MSTIIRLEIHETYKNRPANEQWVRGEIINQKFVDEESLKAYLTERYGHVPSGKKKIFLDRKDGKPIKVGFLHTFWNKDYSYNSKSYYQQDWLSLWKEDNTRTYFQLGHG
jgi:hypothetical protein